MLPISTEMLSVIPFESLPAGLEAREPLSSVMAKHKVARRNDARVGPGRQTSYAAFVGEDAVM